MDIFAISALRNLRINSSVFPENMPPQITSIQPEFIGVSAILAFNQLLNIMNNVNDIIPSI